MKRDKDLILKTTTDIKVFLLFILDHIVDPIDRTTLFEIVEENTEEISLDYDECLHQLAASEHIFFDEIGDERYYMISDKGRMVAAELYDSLDSAFRERSLRSVLRHVSFAESDRRVSATIAETSERRFKVTLAMEDRFGELMSVCVTVNSRADAEKIKNGYEAKPDAVYRGVMFSLTGKFEYMP